MSSKTNVQELANTLGQIDVLKKREADCIAQSEIIADKHMWLSKGSLMEPELREDFKQMDWDFKLEEQEKRIFTEPFIFSKKCF